MKSNNVDMLKLLPAFMRSCQFVIEISGITSEIIRTIAEKLPTLSAWGHIDELDEEELDELANELRPTWYKLSLTKEQKRQVLKESDLVYRTLGTPFAVKTVIESIFDNTELREWFEYGGEPHTFKIIRDNPERHTAEEHREFMRMLGLVKRASQALEALILKYDLESVVYSGGAVYEAEKTTFHAERKLPPNRMIETDTQAGGIMKEAE